MIRTRLKIVQIFQRCAKTARLPEKVAEERASGARDRGKKIKPLRSVLPKRKIISCFIACFDSFEHGAVSGLNHD
jgi:hypothetical protein